MKSEFNEVIAKFPDNLGEYNFTENLCSDDIKKIDAADMYSLLANYWGHIKTAIQRATDSSKIVFKEKNPDAILILGIGGSAMSGELLASYLKYAAKTQCPKIILNRDWDIPQNINITAKTWVFACSYSGNTEETLSAFSQVQKFTDNIIAITSGGELEKKCNEKNYQVLKMPTGMMPRCAMFYSFFHLLFTVGRHEIIDINNSGDNNDNDFSHSLDNLLSADYGKLLDYSALDNRNFAIGIAKLLKDKIPVIYTTQARLEAVNLRWRAQIQENANQMCFGNFFPELNHNEINGWVLPDDLLSRFVVLAMKDADDSSVLSDNFDNSIKMLREKGIAVIEIFVAEKRLLERLVQLICIADWVSFYLAIFNNVDPTPIPEIAKLKNRRNC